VRRAVRESVDRHISEHLAQRELTPAAVARAVGVSRTTLYRAFEPAGGINAHIVGRRLDASFAALQLRRGRSPSISEIADRHGFVSHAHFTRAFKARFGIRPRDAS
jgi:AraC-like DNA-binding protein